MQNTSERDPLLRALGSIYYHTYFTDFSPGPSSDPRLRDSALLPPLAEALKTILDPPATPSPRRKRYLEARALAQLSVAQLTTEDGLRRSSLPDDDKAEIMNLVSELAKRLDVRMQPDPEQPEATYKYYMHVMAVGAQSCGPFNPTCAACFDGVKRMNTVTSTGEVERTLAALKSNLHPPNWDNCKGSVFKTAYHVKPDSSSYSVDHPGYREDTSDPPDGQWYYLYEVVDAAVARFRNALALKLTVEPEVLTWEYNMVRNFGTEISGSPEEQLLTHNSGHVKATKITGSRSIVEVKKTIQFSSEALTTWSAPAMCLWLDEAVYLPCCEPRNRGT